jgi:hypothetical protein
MTSEERRERLFWTAIVDHHLREHGWHSWKIGWLDETNPDLILVYQKRGVEPEILVNLDQSCMTVVLDNQYFEPLTEKILDDLVEHGTLPGRKATVPDSKMN